MNNFAVFILTHGRANNVKTIKTLRTRGYTGKIYLIIDNEDDQAEQYYKKYGRENVFMFDKEEVGKTFDHADNFNIKNTITYARNACFDIAKKIGIEYFVQLDDDYTRFEFRITKKLNYTTVNCTYLDQVFESILKFYKSIPALTIAIAQGGDFVTGAGSQFARVNKLYRKAMNSFFCSTNRPFKFVGTMNEDVNTYVRYGSLGNLFFTIPIVNLCQQSTQTGEGGITEMYLKYGTYVKAFYTIIFNPSTVKISMMGTSRRRIHHKINWKTAVPVILNEEHKKKVNG